MAQRISVERDVMVPMRDGVRLATDVYLPPGPGPFPVLLERTPYDKSFAWFTAGLILNPLVAADRGFAVVVQDARGRARSEGDWVPFVHEADDGHDAVEWAAAQDWSTGAVGVFGSSYLGVTSLQAAAAAPPHLRAALAYLTGADYRSGWTYSGGAFELGFNLWWTSFLAWDTWSRDPGAAGGQETLGALVSVASDWWAAARRAPLADMPGFDRAAPYWREWLAHPEPGPFWERVDVTRRASDIRVPLLHVAGWYDNFLRGHLDLQAALQERGDPAVRDHHRFVVGPWDHEAYLSVRPTAAGSRDFGPPALGGVNMMTELALGWFDRWLRDGPDPGLPPVRWFQMGEDDWREAPSWPPEGRERTLHLRSDGHAGTGAGGALADEPGPAEPADAVRHDPTDPVPTVGGRTLAPIFAPGGVQEQAAIAARPDVLVYTSAPLVRPLRVAGPVSAVLHVASDREVVDVSAKLVDVAPSGTATNVAEGHLRLRTEPGAPVEATVDLWDVGHTFLPGHAVRLQLAPSNFPRFDLAPGPSTLLVHHDAERPSRLVLHEVAR